jgi:hypothetical protein
MTWRVLHTGVVDGVAGVTYQARLSGERQGGEEAEAVQHPGGGARGGPPRHRCKTVQVDPIKPTLKAPGIKLYD